MKQSSNFLIMNRKNFLRKTFFALLAASFIFCGCSKKEDEPILKLTFADDISETKASSYNIRGTIESINGLQKVMIEKVYLSDTEDELIDEITDFENPKEYHFQVPVSVTKFTTIRFTATDVKGNSIVKSFFFTTGSL